MLPKFIYCLAIRNESDDRLKHHRYPKKFQFKAKEKYVN